MSDDQPSASPAAATADDRTRLMGLIRDMALRVPTSQPRLRREDLTGAVASGMLFLVGYHWGRHSYANRWSAGLAFLFVGLLLVGTAIALGG